MRAHPGHRFLALTAALIPIGCYQLDFSERDGGQDSRVEQGLGPDSQDAPSTLGDATDDSSLADRPGADDSPSHEVGGDAIGSGSLVGTPCTTPMGFGCDGHMSQLQLFCSSTSTPATWQAIGMCRDGEYCDNTDGKCRVQVPECAGKQPGETVCMSGTIRECGPDLVTTLTANPCDTPSDACARCRPVVLATQQSSPRQIAALEEYVYWTDWVSLTGTSTIQRVSKTGGSSELIQYGSDLQEASSVIGLAADGAYAYWVSTTRGMPGTTSMRVYRLGTSAASPTVIAESQSGLVSPSSLMVVADKYVYWNEPPGVLVRRVLKEGGSIESAIVNPSGSIGGLAGDSGAIYWTDPWSGTVMQMSESGGDATALASSLSSPGDIFLHGGYVYWTNRESGQVMRMQRSGGTPATLATGQAGAIAHDTSYIYWIDTRGWLMRLPLAGGTPVMMASGLPEAVALAADDTSLYWTSGSLNSTEGTVMSIRK